MSIGERLRAIRLSKNLSQGALQKRTGMLRYYISRVENGHTVPSIQTLERMVQAMGVELHQLFFDSTGEPTTAGTDHKPPLDKTEATLLKHFRGLSRDNKRLVVFVARDLAKRASD